MKIWIQENEEENGKEAAIKGGTFIKEAINQRGSATIILATGTSQFHMLQHLIAMDIDWSRVEVFHLDEYVGLSDQHPASFRKYLRERFEQRVKNLKRINYINGDAPDLSAELGRLNDLLNRVTIDVAFVGVGENGHLAFNDPPADFNTQTPYLVVTLDQACRRQQMGEGWFPSIDDVPPQAISMGIRQILKSRVIINTVPGSRKSKAVAAFVLGKVDPHCPASILQTHPNCYCFFDREAVAELCFKS
jgi:glucosamine-6-phosphate deaminase